MTSKTSKPAADEIETTEKDVWVVPSVMRIHVGDAEASDGPGPDSGLAS